MKTKNFVLKLAQTLNISPDVHRLSFAQFSKGVYDVIGFDDEISHNKEEMLEFLTH